MKHTIIVLVENQPGVLARIVGLISGRGYNIESLNVGPTHDPAVSRMTIQCPGDDRVLEQVTKQLNKLVDVIKVTDVTKQRFVDQELVLVKVTAAGDQRRQIIDLVEIFDGKIVSVLPGSIVIRLADDQERVNDFLELMKAFRILDVGRSGVLAMGVD